MCCPDLVGFANWLPLVAIALKKSGVAGRRATIQPATVNECIREEIQKVFAAGAGVERIYFLEKTSQVPDRPAVTLVILSPDDSL